MQCYSLTANNARQTPQNLATPNSSWLPFAHSATAFLSFGELCLVQPSSSTIALSAPAVATVSLARVCADAAARSPVPSSSWRPHWDSRSLAARSPILIFTAAVEPPSWQFALRSPSVELSLACQLRSRAAMVANSFSASSD